MKLLVVTQVMDTSNSNLGFFHEWIIEFAKHCEQVEVICLYQGRHHLPENVRVHSLGKESSGASRGQFLLRFWKLVWSMRGDYDAVFVHMNPEYLVLAGPLWRLLGKPSALWYAHRSVTLKLRVATFFANYIFTVAPGSMRIDTPKKHAVGHGIDTKLFTARPHNPLATLRLVTIGRVAQSKHLREMLDVLDELHARHVAFVLTVVGAPLTREDEHYLAELREEIEKRPYKDSVLLVGAKPHTALPEILTESDVALNLSTTGNMDKAGLEALLMGVPLVATNTAFNALPALPGLVVCDSSARAIADAIQNVHLTDVSALSGVVRAEHSLAALVPKILAVLARS